MTRKKTLPLALVLPALLAGPAARAQHKHAPEDKHEHQHAHEHAPPAAPGAAKLTLNQGQKWPTDAPLREGMSAVRGEVAAALERVHADTYTPAQYEALAARIEAQLASILSSCKLPPDADAQLHLVLAEAYAATGAMKAGSARRAGVVRLVRALETYGTHFEHAGWKPLAH